MSINHEDFKSDLTLLENGMQEVAIATIEAALSGIEKGDPDDLEWFFLEPPNQIHLSLPEACKALGISPENLRREAYKITPTKIQKRIMEAKKAGLPVLIEKSWDSRPNLFYQDKKVIYDDFEF